MNWILGIAAAIVALVLLDVFVLAAMWLGHKINEWLGRRARAAMPSRDIPCQVYAWPDENRTP